jgi:crotonobetainyl-CoA:carnitine CoA-transferase CaiB-like acyl-CoA transferase
MVRTSAGVRQVGSPVRFDGERADADLPPPGLGAHTSEVLGSLGLGPEELQRLRVAKIVG